MLNNLKIRKAQIKDVDLLYKWSNDELVRKQSFSPDEISYKSHCNWFEQKLKDATSILFIVEADTIPASIVRFDKKENEFVVGISIDKEFREKGLGGKFIAIGVKEYFKGNELHVLAYIKKDNIASVKSFQKAGFVYLKDDTIGGVESVVYKIDKNE